MTTYAAELPNTEEGAPEEIRIQITDAGRENLLLRRLVHEAIPLLRCPQNYGDEQRGHLARLACQALDGFLDDEILTEDSLGEEEGTPW